MVGEQEMKELANAIIFLTESREIEPQQIRGPGKVGFALLTFELGKPGLANYVSNCQREDMIKALKETVERLEGGQTFNTPNEN